MLQIERRIGEGIEIAGLIRVSVKEVRGGKRVKLQIDAPRDIKVLRDELVDADASERLLAEALLNHLAADAVPA